MGIFQAGVFLIPILHFERDFPERQSNNRKRYLLDVTISLATIFFPFFIITFCIDFTRTEKKYVKVIDDDICNRKIEFKAESEIMKKKRNYNKVGKKIWGVLKCKEIVALRDFLYKV